MTRSEFAALVDELVRASRDAGWSWMEQHADRADSEARQAVARDAVESAFATLAMERDEAMREKGTGR